MTATRPTDAANVTSRAGSRLRTTRWSARCWRRPGPWLARGRLPRRQPDPVKIGIGQSMGGALLDRAAGTASGPSTAIGVARLLRDPDPGCGRRRARPRLSQRVRAARLFPRSSPTSRRTSWPVGRSSRPTTRVCPSSQPGFHYDDVPREIVQADLGGSIPRSAAVLCPEWGTAKTPACAISLPVTGGVCRTRSCGDRRAGAGSASANATSSPSPHEEPRAYQRSPDVTVYICPRMAHMHNFASTREAFWRRLHLWGNSG